MTDLRIDHTRAEADRRMRLLEMAGGDLEKAREMELWVISGCAARVTVEAAANMIGNVKIVGTPGHNPFPPPEATKPLVYGGDDGLTIPPHLRRTA